MTIGRYQCESIIATGESSTIYRARGPLGPAAVKVLHPHLASDPVVCEQFVRGSQTIASLSAPGIPRVFDVVRDSEVVASAMELLDGGSLDERRDVDDRLLLRSLLRTLSIAHAAGVVHRDIRPSHIVFGSDGRPRVVDFTGSSLRDLVGLSRSTVHTSRRDYADPYSWGTGSPSPTQDIYSVGAVLFERLYGRPPSARIAASPTARPSTGAPPTGDSTASAPDTYVGAVVQAMIDEPSRRPGSADEVLSWLESGSSDIRGRITECLYCGALLPAESPLCLECGKEPLVVAKDPNGEYIALRKISEEQDVLGPFLRKLRLLSADPDPETKLIIGDARLYSRDERNRGHQLPVRIVDEIDSRSVVELIGLLLGDRRERIRIERYPMSRRNKVKRGPLIRIADTPTAPRIGIDSLRRAAGRTRHTESHGQRTRFLHSLGIASRRLGRAGGPQADFAGLIDALDGAASRYDELRRSLGEMDLPAAYADLERHSSTDAPDTEAAAVFEEYERVSRRLAAIESALSKASLLLQNVTSDTAASTLEEVASLLSSAGGRGLQGRDADSDR